MQFAVFEKSFGGRKERKRGRQEGGRRDAIRCNAMAAGLDVSAEEPRTQ